MIRNANKTRALLIALAMTLALAAPAAGVSQMTTAETLTINAEITLTGVPASASYGSQTGAGTAMKNIVSNGSGSETAPIAFSTNSAKGATLNITASALTRSGGSETIAASQRAFSTTSTGTTGCTSTLATAVPSTPNYSGSTTPLCATAAPGEGQVNLLRSQIFVPAGVVAGTYNGTLTFAVAANP